MKPVLNSSIFCLSPFMSDGSVAIKSPDAMHHNKTKKEKEENAVSDKLSRIIVMGAAYFTVRQLY